MPTPPADDKSTRYPIEIEADEGTRLSLLDGHLNEVASAWKILKYDAPPGLYKIVAQAGFTVKEEHLIINGEVKRKFERFPIATPAPLASSHKPLALAPLERALRSALATSGRGDSSVFVFRRGPAGSRPLDGLRLCDPTGELVADLGERAAGPFAEQEGQTFWACNVAVEPGSYRLAHCNEERPGFIEQTLVAVARFQLQIFLRERPLDTSAVSPWHGLGGAAIFYAEPGRFDAASEEARLTELMKIALVTRRPKVSERAWNGVLKGDYKDPMLGLYAAALSWVLPRPEWLTDELLAAHLEKLARILGPEHPDVSAMHPPPKGVVSPIDCPPMLRHSWDRLIRASASRSDLLARDGVAVNVARRLLAGGPWLLWSMPAHPAGAGAALATEKPRVTYDLFTRAFSAFLHPRRQREEVAVRPTIRDDEWEELVSALNLPRPEVERLLDGLSPKSGPEYWEWVRHAYLTGRAQDLCTLLTAERVRVVRNAMTHGLSEPEAQQVARDHCLWLLQEHKKYDARLPIDDFILSVPRKA
jgi:hypothetical protein